jgi:subtilisin-like proprotein convertase family protein
MSARLKTLLLVASALFAITGAAAAQDTGDRISPRLERVLASGDKDAATAVWVLFADKGLPDGERATALAAAARRLDTATAARRTRGTLGSNLVDEADLPLATDYLEAVTATGASLRRQSRWLNAASFDATASQIDAISRLPFVARLEVVAVGRGNKPVLDAEPSADLQARLDQLQGAKSLSGLDYGASLPGLEQINVPAVHALGLSGRGVTIAHFDTGFELDHESLTDLDVIATYDFINDDDYVGPRKNDDIFQALYGTASLSVMAGFSRSNLIGPAYNARLILAKTEDLESETPAEEDNWIAALEWAEGLGADIVSSGLGYYSWYEFSDMDGYTALITVAAELAAARGVCVVNTVGDMRANQEWPHLLPPADGRSVIAVGAVDVNDQVTWFSGPGPTADGRTKPDVMAFGFGHPVAVDRVLDLYNFGFGTNYAVPLVTGVVALMLEQNPSLGPLQIMEALKMTASRTDLPDNDFGWGIIDAMAAVRYWAPAITHTPLKDTEGGLGAHRVTATITDRQGLDTDRLYVAWRVAGGSWGLVPMTADGGDIYTGLIPPQDRSGTDIEYYIAATGSGGLASSHPADAPISFHAFREGADTTPPFVKHLPPADMTTAHWPPTLRVEATDNKGMDAVTILYTIPGLGTLGPYPLTDMGDHYAIEIPTPVESVFPGFTISYLFVATDIAATPNQTLAGSYDFRIVGSKGSVLVVDDRNNSKSADSDRPGAELAQPGAKSASLLSTWLTDAGFSADTIAASAVKSSSFLGYDVVMVSSGSNFAPYAYAELLRTMVAWVDNGGKIIVEGGETGYAAAVSPGYPELMGTVLPIVDYGGEDGASLWQPAELADLPLLNRPHPLPVPFVIDNNGGFDYGASDVVVQSPEAFVALRAGLGGRFGGMVVYDNNTGPESGQIVYFPFDIAKASDADGRALLDNAATYLVTEEPPGTGSVSGQVTLAGQEDYSGVTVRVGTTHSAETAADGSYSLTGLWGGDYKVVVESAGYAPRSRTVTVTDGADTGETHFYLVPVTEVTYTSAPGIAIPDNDPVGVTDAVTVTESGEVFGITVDADISHFAIGQLVITLTNPAGTVVTLHNRTGGTSDDLVGNWPATLFVDGPGGLDDFNGETAAGAWSIQVSDQQFGALGTLNSWSLNLLVRAGGAAPVDDPLPTVTRLVGNAPNPFNPRTVIAFELARAGQVRLEVFDVRGRLVRRLADRSFAAGRHTALWDGRDNSGGEAASGLYFYRLRAGNLEQTNKMLLVR